MINQNSDTQTGLLSAICLTDNDSQVTRPWENEYDALIDRPLWLDTRPVKVIYGGKPGYLFVVPHTAVASEYPDDADISVVVETVFLNSRHGKVFAEVTSTPSRTRIYKTEWLNWVGKYVEPIEVETKKLSALALLNKWLSEDGDSNSDEDSLGRAMAELDEDRQGHRQLFKAE